MTITDDPREIRLEFILRTCCFEKKIPKKKILIKIKLKYTTLGAVS